MFISTLRSCYSPSFYREVADQTDGIGLSFLFMAACVMMAVLYAVLIINFGFHFTDNVRDFLNANGGGTVVAFAAGFSNPITNFCIITLFCVFLLMIVMLDIAVVFAMVCMLIDMALQARLSFVQVLRMASYAQVAAYTLVGVIEFILYKTQLMVITFGGLKSLWIALTLGYTTFGMYCARSD